MEITKFSFWVSLWIFLNYVWLSQETLLIYCVLMVIDMITWVTASYFVDKKDVKSSIFMKWFVKKIFTLLLPFVSWLSMKALWISQDIVMYFVWLCVSILISVETYSIIANIYTIRKWERIGEMDATEKLIKFILSFFQKKLEWLEKDLSNNDDSKKL